MERELLSLWAPGEPSLFPMLSWLMGQEHLWDTGRASIAAHGGGDGEEGQGGGAESTGERQRIREEASSRTLSGPEEALLQEVRSKAVHGEPFTERKSTFQVRGPRWTSGGRVVESSVFAFVFWSLAAVLGARWCT